MVVRASCAFWSLRRVFQTTALHAEKWRQTVRSCVRSADDVTHAPFPCSERIGNERAMAAPRDSFGAHDSHTFFARRLFEICETFGESRRGHVIGKAPKGRIAPGC